MTEIKNIKATDTNKETMEGHDSQGNEESIDIALGTVSFEDNGNTTDLYWNVTLWPENHDRYPGVRDVSLTDLQGDEIEFDEVNDQIIEAILKHIGE